MVGVQAEGCAAFPQSLREHQPVAVGAPSTIADGIAVKRPGELTLGLVGEWVDDVVIVDDDAIAEAMVLLVERGEARHRGRRRGQRRRAEQRRRRARAARRHGRRPLRRQRRRPRPGGGDQPAPDRGRSPHPPVHPDQPTGRTGLADLLQAVADAGGNVLDVTHVRDGVSLNVDETGVEVLLESRSQTHREQLLEELAAAGYRVEELR